MFQLWYYFGIASVFSLTSFTTVPVLTLSLSEGFETTCITSDPSSIPNNPRHSTIFKMKGPIRVVLAIQADRNNFKLVHNIRPKIK